MFLKKFKARKILFISIFISLLFFGTIFGLVCYQQSSFLKNQAEELIKQGRREEAIILYDRAHEVFPWRRDVTRDSQAAQLVVESDLDYGKIYQIGEKNQSAPTPIGSLSTRKTLLPNELYVPILMYHHIRVNPRPENPVWAALNVSPSQLDSQIQYLLSKNYHTVTLEELNLALSGQISLPENPIILTFDDGYNSFYSAVFPLLTKYQVKAVDFVITDVVGTSSYLSWDEIFQIDKSGLVQWGAHTRHHPNLLDLSQSSIFNEITGSKANLENHLHKPITWFAYPYGSYNDFIIKTVRDAGFNGAVSTIYGAGQSKEKIFLLPRIMVDGRFSLKDFAARL